MKVVFGVEYAKYNRHKQEVYCHMKATQKLQHTERASSIDATFWASYCFAVLWNNIRTFCHILLFFKGLTQEGCILWSIAIEFALNLAVTQKQYKIEPIWI